VNGRGSATVGDALQHKGQTLNTKQPELEKHGLFEVTQEAQEGEREEYGAAPALQTHPQQQRNNRHRGARRQTSPQIGDKNNEATDNGGNMEVATMGQKTEVSMIEGVDTATVKALHQLVVNTTKAVIADESKGAEKRMLKAVAKQLKKKEKKLEKRLSKALSAVRSSDEDITSLNGAMLIVGKTALKATVATAVVGGAYIGFKALTTV